jgi:hypothetical protein
MSQRFSHSALIPVIRIDEPTLSALTATAKQASASGSPDSAVLVGNADFSRRSPELLFTKLNQYPGSTDSESDIASASADEILGYVLFQKDPEIDWDRCLKNYLDANQSIEGYTCSYYYQPVFTAVYHNRLIVHCYLLTPDLSVTITRIGDATKCRDSKKVAHSVTHSNTHEQLKHIDTTFVGLTNCDDPRILALAYSLSLAYENKPIRAVIGTSVYNLEVQVGDAILCCEGDGRLENGIVTIALKSQTEESEPDPDPEPTPKAPQQSEGALLQSLTQLKVQVNELQKRCQAQQEMREKLENREADTQRILRKILDALASKPPQETAKVPRFAAPRNGGTPKRRAVISVHISQQWEAPEPDPLDRPLRTTPPVPAKDSTTISQSRVPKRTAQLATPKNADLGQQKQTDLDSPQLPPPASKRADPQPPPNVLASLADPSFVVEDYSKLDEMQSLFSRLGITF